MIQEEYVAFDTAKLLKEAGYPQNFCATRYDSEGNRFLQHTAEYAAPTQAQAMRWLREEKHIAIVIEYTRYNGWEYTLLLDYDTAKSRLCCSIGAPTYEAAAETGIQAVCEYLIEMQKGGDE